jgi:hypothetical protein
LTLVCLNLLFCTEGSSSSSRGHELRRPRYCTVGHLTASTAHDVT